MAPRSSRLGSNEAQEVWAPFPSVLFGSFALLSGLLIFTTPETLGTKLPDTIEEAEQLGNKHKQATT
ncbi:Organic cation transporter [Operophtera brumata]|uniref:Organic cation transporter n=1 Tax=Operophtera brumata TaxID=104452 RepID=A0A0L7KT92_OPEBR|nr:Organic cation transporter [Operophtera brumata]